MSPILGIIDSSKYGALNSLAGNYYAIATATVTSGGQTTISFTSIPQGYSHLQIRIYGKSNGGTYPTDGVNLAFNGSTTSTDYDSHNISGNGTSATAGATTCPNCPRLTAPVFTICSIAAAAFCAERD